MPAWASRLASLRAPCHPRTGEAAGADAEIGPPCLAARRVEVRAAGRDGRGEWWTDTYGAERRLRTRPQRRMQGTHAEHPSEHDPRSGGATR